MTSDITRRAFKAARHPFRGGARLLGKDRSLRLLRAIARVSRFAARRAHLAVVNVQWGAPPEPEWHDHLTTHYALWELSGQPFLAERGAMVLPAIPLDAAVLDLCCGDGYYTRYFHAGRAKSIIALDFDPAAIAFAGKYHSASNVTFRVGDIRTQIPEGPFDTIIWNGAIEHFTPDEIAKLIVALRERLKPEGILTGYTIAALTGDQPQLSHHEYEFQSKEDLLRFFTPHFKQAKVIESFWPKTAAPGGVARHNLYFYASDGVLPFDRDWPMAVEERHG